MSKLSVLIAAIVLPFFYSIGCEVPLGPPSSELVVSSDAGAANGLVTPVGQQIISYPDYLKENGLNFSDPDALEGWYKLFDASRHEQFTGGSKLWPSVEASTQNAIFMSANTVLLATVLAPIILQVGMDDDNWDAKCALAYQIQGSGMPKKDAGFVMNKTSTTYVSEHAILAEGMPDLKDGKVVLKDAKIFKSTDSDKLAQVATYRHNRWWWVIHKKDSDWVDFRPMTRDQEKRLIAEVRRINGVKDDTASIQTSMETIQIE